ncbi:hypothetical protein ABEW19_02680 [Paenibacillus illinoisensis]|uniref:hypothetical protein n=1 Tax=Paenibacillus illinoisensis TaxID=59845 RepID=UPI003D2AAD20
MVTSQVTVCYGLFLKQGSDTLFTTSPLDKSEVYILNKNLKTFFLFHLIRNELAAKMRLEGVYTSDKYASKLRDYFENVDPIRNYVFRIDADTPKLRLAVQNELNNLKTKYPDYNFSAEFGGKE